MTSKPTTINSNLVCYKVQAEVTDKIINITIFTSLPHNNHKQALCESADLGNLQEGEYEVFYKSPDEKTVTVGNIIIKS